MHMPTGLQAHMNICSLLQYSNSVAATSCGCITSDMAVFQQLYTSTERRSATPQFFNLSRSMTRHKPGRALP